jgi:putative membrane protein (TIGR04086 family)
MDHSIRQNTKLLAVLKGLLFSYIITAFILLLLSFLMLSADLPSMVISAGVIIAYIASTFIGGLIVGKKAEQKKFLWGLILGVFYFILLMMVSMLMNKAEPVPLGNLFTAFLICSLSGMAGGMIS